MTFCTTPQFSIVTRGFGILLWLPTGPTSKGNPNAKAVEGKQWGYPLKLSGDGKFLLGDGKFYQHQGNPERVWTVPTPICIEDI
jgi:hypothetical protein